MNAFVERVRRAEEALGKLFPSTPLQRNAYLSRKTGAEIYLKREDLTPVRSYKLRGAFTFIRRALEADPTVESFVCASAGNHAQGFAYACRHFQKKGVVFMPVTTPQQKIDKTRLFGGEFIEVQLVGDFFDECNRAAEVFAASTTAIMVPPFDHVDIIEGQATIAHELVQQLGDRLDGALIILPVGGGGLAAGVTSYLHEIGAGAQFMFVEPSGAPSLARSLEAGRRVKLPQVDNFIDGAAVAEIGKEPFRRLKSFPLDLVHLVPENSVCATIIEMLNVEGVVLEPAGALSIDVLKTLPRASIKGRTVVCLISGGNFDFERLPDVKERALRFEGKKKYFIFRFPQRPGALRDFLDLLGPEDDITRFEYLKKSARNFGSVLIGIETKDPRHFKTLLKRFEDSGWAYQDITENDTISSLLI
ncbi:L-threonine dehydratase [Nitratireductor aestuarii]|uniref:L-threonine dehydratase n=1 Tax=Nitratireductor aestuarii TaxID=1735103 RepID=A0A916RSR6_9HYPH|nr:threonine ammonia-lyase IlvA [Nitratireductor aestuarii]GGA69422.1 L-threonine dehydratase [Nitratireductor aestuarii]